MDEKVILEIGRVSVNFSNLELLVSAFISKLASDDPKIGAIIASEMSFRNLLNAFSSLYQYKIKDVNLVNKLNEIIKLLGNAEEKRNQLIHSTYASPHGEDKMVRIKITAKQNKGLKFTHEPINIELLQKHSQLQAKLFTDLLVFFGETFPGEKLQFG